MIFDAGLLFLREQNLFLPKKGFGKLFKLMIVDDEEIIRIEIKRLIEKSLLGFTLIDEAANGFEAITKLVNQPVDLVITDIKMPKIDGIELLKEVKERNLASCVILISGYSILDLPSKVWLWEPLIIF